MSTQCDGGKDATGGARSRGLNVHSPSLAGRRPVLPSGALVSCFLVGGELTVVGDAACLAGIEVVEGLMAAGVVAAVVVGVASARSFRTARRTCRDLRTGRGRN